MSLLSLFGTDYKPTAIFSFEFFPRNSDGSLGNKSYGEIFFLLPPENYSIQEGYRVTLTKTAGGGWVDDFGNDFKKIRLSGSLYNYYMGYVPTGRPTMPSDGDKFFQKAGKAILAAGSSAADALKQTVMGAGSAVMDTFGINIPGLSGMSGLEEFYKLRYILSRFRDEYSISDGQRLISKPKFLKDKNTDEIFKASKERRQLFDKIGVVYHDYDDANHFEVIFDSFVMGRDKGDPFTTTYSIEMTALRELYLGYLGVGKIVRKEDPSAIFADFKARMSALLSTLKDMANFPSQFAKTFLEIFNLATSVYTALTDFVNAAKTDWKTFTKFLGTLKQKQSAAIQGLYVLTYGTDYTTLTGETDNLTDPNLLKWTDTLEQGLQLASEMLGSGKYLPNNDPEQIWATGNKVLSDSDFNTSTESNSSKIQTPNTKVSYGIQEGDTLASLGLNFYGDPEMGSVIAEANGLTNRDFENQNMTGKNIIVPLHKGTDSNLNTKNMVYYEKLGVATPVERQLQILGSDFNFNQDREIVVDGSGDLAMVYGEDCFNENLNDRLSFPIGTLAPFDPGWGIQLNIGACPTVVALSKILDNIEEQVYRDPRVETSFLDRDNIDVTADSVSIMLSVKAYSGQEEIIDVGKLISPLL